jgi:hypothetical protein
LLCTSRRSIWKWKFLLWVIFSRLRQLILVIYSNYIFCILELICGRGLEDLVRNSL